ncbi:MAG: DUF2335 domain-containing protein [Pelagibacterales bacterium]|nr:DUF2335 domain-containing protein [Pelagibacterales bacterium]
MQNNRNRNNRNNKEEIHLPSSQILEKFEDAVPNSVERLVEMAQKEQKHRHDWQDRYLSSHNFSYRSGQLFGLIYNLGILYLVYSLFKEGDKSSAIKLFLINAAVVTFAIVFTTFERRIFTRRPEKKFKNKNRNRNKSNPKNKREKQ